MKLPSKPPQPQLRALDKTTSDDDEEDDEEGGEEGEKKPRHIHRHRRRIHSKSSTPQVLLVVVLVFVRETHARKEELFLSSYLQRKKCGADETGPVRNDTARFGSVLEMPT